MTQSYLSNLPIPLVLIAAVLTASPSAAGDRVYQYNQQGDAPLFTDKKQAGIQPSKVHYYGRPTAVTSGCNLSTKRLKQRISEYDDAITEMSQKYAVPKALIKAVITAESCYNPKAVSTAGAQGLMQLMPATARMLKVADPFDPSDNIHGGVRYLRMMLDEFEQDQRLALAAYNAGPNAVKKYGAIPPYRETRQYVKKIMKLLES